jgi:hypothetical protein
MMTNQISCQHFFPANKPARIKRSFFATTFLSKMTISSLHIEMMDQITFSFVR